jgi:DNA-binding response OmpR family regulator
LERIVIVDDEPDIANMFRTALEMNGYVVDVFSDPVKALADFSPGRYDLVISDMKLPNMNGLEMVFEMEKIDSRIQVMFLTGYADLYAETRKLFSKMNVRAMLQKPIGIDELMNKIAEMRTSGEPQATHDGPEKAGVSSATPPRKDLTKPILEASLGVTLGDIAQQLRPKLEFSWPEFIDAVNDLVMKGSLQARGNGFEVLYSRTEVGERQIQNQNAR